MQYTRAVTSVLRTVQKANSAAQSRRFLGSLAQGRIITPEPINEPILSYLPGSPEREELEATIKQMRSETVEVPLLIGGQEVKTGDLAEIRPPHDKGHLLGHYHRAGVGEVKMAIEASMEASKMWQSMNPGSRIAIILKMAELLAGPYRQRLNAATILGQSKNFYQAEIDAACETIDFWRFNARYAQEIYEEQAISPRGVWNRLLYRPLEGFVYAITPFNFTAIAANLTTAPALMGNVVVWKPSDSQIYSANVLNEIYKEAGLPDGVINFVPGDPELVTDVCLHDKNFTSLHYTGSTKVFQGLWREIGNNMGTYKTYPRIVGETGGKDFIFAHQSANAEEVAVAIVRGGFEYAGQKCSACSRAYIPKSMWPDVKAHIQDMMRTVSHGNPEDPKTFVNAVIHQASFDRCKSYLKHAHDSPDCEIVVGGNCDDSEGFFVEPTVVDTKNANDRLMSEEIFGPIVAIHVYDDDKFEDTLEICDKTSNYALTGAVFSTDRAAIETSLQKLQHAAGNFYINDKCTGSVVGQQPFGGARLSGTNDKAGSKNNLLRFTSVFSIKENLVPPKEHLYPYMK